MSRGAKAKTYPAAFVSEVRRLYGEGMTQVEIARELQSTQKVVWRLMRRHGIGARPAIKRDSGDYHNVHDYVRLCASCHRRFDGIVGNTEPR
jgi:CBS domain-containing protein